MRDIRSILVLSAAALMAAAGVCRASGEPAVSTAAPAAVQSPMVLSVYKDARRFRVELAYVVKWDFKDVASVRPRAIYSGVTAYSWAVVENTRLTCYGVTTIPSRMFIVKRNESQPSGSAPGGPGKPGGAARTSIHLSLMPLVHDLTSDLNVKLGTFLLNTSMHGSHEWGSMGAENRNSMVRDVLAMPVWETPLPLLGQAKKELEYASKPEAKPAGSAPQPFTISTQPAAGSH